MAFSLQQLQDFRQIGDPLADSVMNELLSGNTPFDSRSIFEILITNAAPIPENIPQPLKEFFEKTQKLPEWADHEKIKIAEQLYLKHGPTVNLILFCKSLPECYSCAKGAKVLHQTGRMAKDGNTMRAFSRRLMETAQFVVNVLSKDGLGEKGTGIRTTQKVRLIHATIRHFTLKGGWDSESMGVPINQEDLLGTLISFGVTIIEGLEMLGIKLTEKQRNAFIHLWNVVGYILGIEQSPAFETQEEGLTLKTQILNHQGEFSEEGVDLTEACVLFMENIIPGTQFDKFPKIMMRYLCGDKVSDSLKIEEYENPLTNLIPRFLGTILKGVDKLEDKHKIVRKLAFEFNRRLTIGLIHYYNEGKKIHFYLPPDLRKNWGIDENWVDRFVLISNFKGNRIVWQKKEEGDLFNPSQS